MKVNTVGRPRVFVTRRLPGTAGERLVGEADVDYWDEDRLPSAEDMRRRVAGAHALLTMSDDRVDVDVLDHGKDLVVVANMAAGYNNLDLHALTSRGIPASNTPGVLTEATADLTFALVLACARRIIPAREALLQGEWNRWDPEFCLGLEMSGATLGIVGTGRIGEAVARRARAFNMNLLGWSRSQPVIKGLLYVSLEELLAASNVVTLHVALTPETRHLIGQEQFHMMKKSAILINTARGGIIDQGALTEALRSGEIGGAGLDVFEQEPILPGDPLLALDHCVATPHIGSASLGTRSAMANLAVDNVLAGLRGIALPNCINPEVYASPAR